MNVHRRKPDLRRTAVAGMLMLVCASGCFSPMHTRLPTLWPSHPQTEAQAFQLQDPFPDNDIGPDVQARPRGFDRPRTEARRGAELRLLHGLSSGPEGSRPGVPQGGLRRPSAAY